MYERILIPIDFSPCSENAIRFAKRLAAPKASARLLHVLVGEESMPFAGLPRAEGLRDALSRGLEERRQAHGSDAFELDVALREGAIEDEIEAEVAAWEPDLIVLGSHGRRGLSRLLLGSVAERVLRASSRPVCIVKDPLPEGATLERVVCATALDGSSISAREHFGRILGTSGARGMLVHAFRADQLLALAAPPPPLGAGAYPAPTLSEEEIAQRIEEARRKIEAALIEEEGALRDQGVLVERRILEAEPWTALADLAETEEIDLILLGSHQYGGVRRFLLGSIAEKALRTVPCPVLVVPRPHTAS